MNTTKNITEESDFESFRAWYRNRPAQTIPDLRKQIIDACKLTVTENKRCHVLDQWVLGRVNVPPLAQEQINVIAGMKLDYTIQKVYI